MRDVVVSEEFDASKAKLKLPLGRMFGHADHHRAGAHAASAGGRSTGTGKKRRNQLLRLRATN